MTTILVPRPYDPFRAALAVVQRRTWTLLVDPDEPEPMDLTPSPMTLDCARGWQREATIWGNNIALAQLVRHDVADGTWWAWETPQVEPTGPVGIQRQRAKGWSKPDGCVIVDRTSRWGNPFRVESLIAEGLVANQRDGRRLAVLCFDEWLDGHAWFDVRPDLRRRIIRELPALRGKDLACACPVDYLACHRWSLIKRANDETWGPRP